MCSGWCCAGRRSRSLAEYLRNKLWQPLGMEADGFWMVDAAGAEMAGVGLNAVLRDYARLGCCYLNGGAWNGVQVVPERLGAGRR